LVLLLLLLLDLVGCLPLLPLLLALLYTSTSWWQSCGNLLRIAHLTAQHTQLPICKWQQWEAVQLRHSLKDGGVVGCEGGGGGVRRFGWGRRRDRRAFGVGWTDGGRRGKVQVREAVV